MAKYTSKLNLKKPEANDFYNVEDSNGNFDKIDEFASRTDNPHSVTKAQVGLGNVDNTSDKNKPISTAQATAIAEAKSAGTNAQANINGHINNKSNPHNITVEQIGALSSGGGTITGNLNIAKTLPRVQMKDTDVERFGVFEITPEGYVGIGNWKSTSDHINLQIRPSSVGVNEAIRFTVDGTKAYLLYGEHNMPHPVQIEVGDYVGGGTTGKNNAIILNFPFVPEVLFITAIDYNSELPDLDPPYKAFPYGALVYATYELADKEYDVPIMSSTNCTCKISNGGKTLSFYSATNTNASHMANTAGVKYYYVAIGYRKEW